MRSLILSLVLGVASVVALLAISPPQAEAYWRWNRSYYGSYRWNRPYYGYYGWRRPYYGYYGWYRPYYGYYGVY
jgi:hypothetical protein